MKIIGAGYGRTGTKSLQLALEQLGFGKCYHMEELLRNPSGVIHWENAYHEQDVDWDLLFKKYNSIVDFPGSMYYDRLADFYQEAKVILTIRDPEKWYESVNKTIFRFDPGPSIKLKLLLSMPFSSTSIILFKVIQLNDKSIWKKYFSGKFKDKEFAIQKFVNHIEEVKKRIPKDRLLVFNVKEGWDPLCAFLNVEVPTGPFPKTNISANFHEWATGVVKEVLQ